MRPLLETELSDLNRLHQENYFQSTRRNELREFWKSGYRMAELQTSGTVKLDTEIRNYKKAARQLYFELSNGTQKFDYMHDIKFHIRQDRIIAERTDGRV